MKLFLNPQPKPKEKLGSGVDVVVYQMHRYLREQSGIDLVTTPQAADIFATHISAEGAHNADVVHCHGLYPTGNSSNTDRWQWQINALVIDSARKAYTVTVPSPWVAEMFERDMGLTPQIVPHGLDLGEWSGRRASRSRTVLWNKNRDVDVCSPAPMNKLAQVARTFSFVSTYGEAAPNVKVIGPMAHPQMKDLLANCGIYLATTKETFGIGILEALICGMPVLAWGWGNAPYLVEHKKTGYIVPPDDTLEAVKGLEYIYENWQELSENAVRAARRFSWPAIISKYADIYQEAFERKTEEAQGHVSFVIPCYNYAKWVGEAIHSVRNQTHANIECIVVDDGSTDGSYEAAVLAAEGDPRVTVITKPNEGVAATRNRGAMLAKGPFLAFLDADDRLRPGFVDRLLPELRKDRALGTVYGKLALMNEEGVISAQSTGWPDNYSADMQLQKKNRVPSCCMMRKDIFLRTGGYRQHTAPTEDAELWARFALIGYGGKLVTEQTVYDYRLHSASASGTIHGKEPNWTAWLPASNGGKVPFAALVSKETASHPVVDYDQPKISFITPVGDKHKDLLQTAIESVAGQIDGSWEMIVVDDTSEGDLKQYGSIPYEIAYPWIRWIRNNKLHNVSAARNIGASAARGKYLCYLDADDYVYHNYVSSMQEVIVYCEGEARVVYSDWVEMPKGEVHAAENWNLERLKDHALFAVTMLVPKSAHMRVGGFDESLDLWEDWEFVLRLALAGYVGIRVPKPLFAYRYDTGTRREESLKDKERLLALIRGRYATAIPSPRRG